MKTIRTFSSNRIFSLWDVLAEDEQLLLRSPKDGDNIDLIFKGVFYLELPQSVRGIKIEKPTPTEVRHVVRRCGRSLVTGEHVFVLASGKSRHLLGAQLLIIEHNSLNSTDPAFYQAKYLHESRQEDFYRQVVKESAQFLP